MSAIDLRLVREPNDDVRALVSELEDTLAAEYPPEQRHGLRLEGLFEPHVRFFVAAIDGAAVGCGGVALFDDFAEAKRMYVRPPSRGRGVAQAILARVEDEARAAGHRVLRLETGDQQHDALRLYRRWGFVDCGPFGAYAAMAPRAIVTSVFLEKPV